MPGGAELSEKLPDEMFNLVEAFKKFVREQKAYRDQKFDVDPILEVDREAEEFMLAFQRVAVDSDINSQLIQQINDDTTKLLRHAELSYSLLRSHIANNPSLQQQQQSTQPTLSSLFGGSPQTINSQQQQQQLQNSTFGLFGSNFNTSNLNTTSGFTTTTANANTGGAATTTATANTSHNPNNHLNSDTMNQTSSSHNQFSNTTSSQYFAELADQFETRMKAYGEQIKELKMSLDSIIRTYNADELFKWLKKQHEALGEIAAKVYITHERIMERKSELDKSNSNAHQQQQQQQPQAAGETTRLYFS